jgi:predicted  nucleic acid-binding Zn-ribbon protein
MACMDHVCTVCGFAWMDNRMAYVCERCGGRVSNDFDEDIGDDEERDDEDDEEQADDA